ncbi:hypothetical protein [Nocardia blacklockiae]|uniref:hypothetical protein n=1 Tax=Nocardia blacklockiae TaxID=480036 RepID=UPI0018946D90|nr:hypothetical protein [Nocardia blacklockiae]MBF6172439.1 hypothetical protein [Nocardia blacklockiae]
MTLREKFELPATADGALVYGAPHETSDGSTVITVARPGLLRPALRPVGVFVVHAGEVTWRPAVDESRIALIAVLTGLVTATLATVAMVKRPPWPELSFHRTETL